MKKRLPMMLVSIVIFLLACVVIYSVYSYLKARKPAEYLWVGPGVNPFDMRPQKAQSVNDFSGEEDEEWAPAENAQEEEE